MPECQASRDPSCRRNWPLWIVSGPRPRIAGVKLLYQGQPVAGALVMAMNKSAPQEVQRVESGADGGAEFQLQRGGLWMVKAVHMVPGAAAEPEDWRSYWASLTFELPAGP